ncbi:MAG TPA: hypothetical protein PKC20_10670, partial [Burkholderiaceae bacterium]|nr:hypothetical protein [Burkholderiaceae bacterium]
MGPFVPARGTGRADCRRVARAAPGRRIGRRAEGLHAQLPAGAPARPTDAARAPEPAGADEAFLAARTAAARGDAARLDALAAQVGAAHPLAADHKPAALCHAPLDHADDAVQGSFRDHGTHRRRLVHRITDVDVAGHGGEHLQVRLVDAALDEQARAVDAALAVGAYG